MKSFSKLKDYFYCSSLPYWINYVYFWYSLVYLFGRTLATQYLAALIHDASNQPLSVLKSVPFKGNCVEIDRFIDQIRTQTMAFSGYRFFYLTRKTIMAVSKTLILIRRNNWTIIYFIQDAGNNCHLWTCFNAVWQRPQRASWQKFEHQWLRFYCHGLNHNFDESTELK